MADTASKPPQGDPPRAGRRWLFRHPIVIRVTHWTNVLCFSLLLMSGYQIFNAHPALYWGNISTFDRPLLAMGADDGSEAGGPQRGVTTILGHSFTTTGLFGVSAGSAGRPDERGFPSWATLPSDQDLATGRRWHFLIAWILVVNGLVYAVYGVLSGQAARRLVPSGGQIRHIGASIREHLGLRFPRGAEASRYNVLQKLTYLVVIVVLFPVQIAAGLAMSPGLDAFAPWLLHLFGGRQSARTIHFVVAHLLVAFVVLHVVMVLVSGVWNNMRGMITGWFAIDGRAADDRS